MRKLFRPDEHHAFEDAVRDAKKNVDADIKKKSETVEFPSKWSAFKDIFVKAQRGKCGYCEGRVWGLQYGDIEHFQPKAEVHELSDNPDHWGRETPWESTVEQRKTENTLKPGYWWQAYEWSNYLISCQICNQQWKKNLYPLKEPRTQPPHRDDCEQPLLLSPFLEDFDPAEHFEYGRLGEISGKSEQGRATIVTCGLDRPSLRLARYEQAKATHEHLDEIAGDITERDMLEMLRYIKRDGDEARPYCGMVHTIFKQRTGLTWEQLSKLISRLEASQTPERSLCNC
ncbi:hypothetical protein [Burkholderia ubonensis]|uniref:hypothetical protein n=1 Tax=Burkholderia ubonensis TaxID=101571 RepID=UPI000ABF209A|nr:hypothetical protein [Burkholderia ubonensis]